MSDEGLAAYEDAQERAVQGVVHVVCRNPDTSERVDFRTWPKDDPPRCGSCKRVLAIVTARDGIVAAHQHAGSNKPREVLLNWERGAKRRRSNLPPGHRDRSADSVPGVRERG